MACEALSEVRERLFSLGKIERLFSPAVRVGGLDENKVINRVSEFLEAQPKEVQLVEKSEAVDDPHPLHLTHRVDQRQACFVPRGNLHITDDMNLWRDVFVPPIRAWVQPFRRHLVRDERYLFFTQKWPVERFGKVAVWHRHAVQLKGARIDFSKADLAAAPGQAPCTAMKTKPGFLQVEDPPESIPPLPLHLGPWMKSLGSVSSDAVDESVPVALAVCRYEERNLFHAMSEIYAAWLYLRYLGHSPEQARILLIDDRDDSPMDEWYRVLFGSLAHGRHLHGVHAFGELLLGIPGYGSSLYPLHQPIDHGAEPFRRFVLERFGIEPRVSKSVQRIVIISRPEIDLDGRCLRRRFANEAELIRWAKEVHPGADVSALDLGRLSLREQLLVINETDLLIGMHGAGMTHAMFLPEAARVFEMFPRDFPPSNDHFRNITLWRKLPYQRWQNLLPSRESPDGATLIPERLFKRRLRVLG